MMKVEKTFKIYLRLCRDKYNDILQVNFLKFYIYRRIVNEK